jgi:hypothetical protein
MFREAWDRLCASNIPIRNDANVPRKIPESIYDKNKNNDCSEFSQRKKSWVETNYPKLWAFSRNPTNYIFGMHWDD